MLTIILLGLLTVRYNNNNNNNNGNGPLGTLFIKVTVMNDCYNSYLFNKEICKLYLPSAQNLKLIKTLSGLSRNVKCTVAIKDCF